MKMCLGQHKQVDGSDGGDNGDCVGGGYGGDGGDAVMVMVGMQ